MVEVVDVVGALEEGVGQLRVGDRNPAEDLRVDLLERGQVDGGQLFGEGRPIGELRGGAGSGLRGLGPFGQSGGLGGGSVGLSAPVVVQVFPGDIAAADGQHPGEEEGQHPRDALFHGKQLLWLMYCNAAGGAARVVDYEEQAKPPLLPPQGVGDSVYRKSVGRDDSARRPRSAAHRRRRALHKRSLAVYGRKEKLYQILEKRSK